MTSLKERLIEQIRAGGPIPFEQFQAGALYDPEGGFFTSKSLRSVKSGDFLTSPEVSPLFGETLARFVDRELATFGAGTPNVSSPGGRRGKWPSEARSEGAAPAAAGGGGRAKRGRRGHGRGRPLVTTPCKRI